MNFEQFYPTPSALARQLVGKLKNREYGAMALEPSAGTGELVKEYCRAFDCESRSIHCIEINDGYGRKAYSDLNAEEKAVADSFEGRESYEETCKNQNFYLPEFNNYLLTD